MSLCNGCGFVCSDKMDSTFKQCDYCQKLVKWCCIRICWCQSYSCVCVNCVDQYPHQIKCSKCNQPIDLKSYEGVIVEDNDQVFCGYC